MFVFLYTPHEYKQIGAPLTPPAPRMRDGVGKKCLAPHQQTIAMRWWRRCQSPCSVLRCNCWFYVFVAMSYCFSGLNEISEARYTANLCVNNVACSDSFRMNAAKWTLSLIHMIRFCWLFLVATSLGLKKNTDGSCDARRQYWKSQAGTEQLNQAQQITGGQW